MGGGSTGTQQRTHWLESENLAFALILPLMLYGACPKSSRLLGLQFPHLSNREIVSALPIPRDQKKSLDCEHPWHHGLSSSTDQSPPAHRMKFLFPVPAGTFCCVHQYFLIEIQRILFIAKSNTGHTFRPLSLAKPG